MDKELISVIIPFYKSELYIRKCVGSVTGQIYKNLEIILVDDGSPDGCGKICDEYAAADARVKVIHKKNKGTSSAYNAGLDRASGEYVIFVDGDDWVEPGYCSGLFENLVKYGADISCCAFFEYRGQKNNPLLPGKTVLYSNLEAVEFLPAPPWGKLYKRALFEGLRYPEDRQPGDLFLTYKVLYRAAKVSMTSAALYNYYRRPDSVMGLALKPEMLHVLDAFEERAAFLDEHGHAALSARIRKLLAATAAYYSHVFSGRSEEVYRNAAKTAGEKLQKTVSQCMRDENLTVFQKAAVFLYGSFPGLALGLAGLKRRIKGS